MPYKSLSGHPIPQREDELAELIQLFQREGVTRYLEIGARYGDSFYHIVRALPNGAWGFAIDLPNGMWGREDSRAHLEARANDLRHAGYRAHAFFGDSTDPEAVAWAASKAPFDAVMIDGDHRLAGVARDWMNYGPMARLVLFHDIDGIGQFERRSGAPVDVPDIWRMVRCRYQWHEIIGKERGMGIGVLWR